MEAEAPEGGEKAAMPLAGGREIWLPLLLLVMMVLLLLLKRSRPAAGLVDEDDGTVFGCCHTKLSS
jgi:hypothetical protein